MKTKIKFSKRDLKVIGITLAAGIFFGWMFFHGSKTGNFETTITEDHEHVDEMIWTCSMHPQVRMDEPGQCPICGMDLIPLTEFLTDEPDGFPDEIQMTETAIKIADIQTMTVHKALPGKEIYLLGKIEPDERNIAELTARYSGRIEKLYVNFTGQNVRKGQKLATVYSPALIAAQKELLEAREYMQNNPELYQAVRNKLKLWDLTDEQIGHIEKEGAVQLYFDVLSPISGTVTKRHVALGDYIHEGGSLFQVIDLTRVWVMFEAYESDLPWISPGDEVDFTVQSLPGKSYSGSVGFINPLMDPQTRIAQVRVEVRNPLLTLKPEMFVNGIVKSAIAGNRQDLMIPKTAVLWTGKRAVVYVKEPEREQPTFRYQEIILGPSAGEFYVVKEGLQEGQEIAVNGVFKIDASAQLAGRSSMMNPSSSRIPEVMYTGGTASFVGQQSQSVESERVLSTQPVHSSEAIELDKTVAENDIDPQFTEQLTEVYKVYLKMKNAFVNSDPDEVTATAENVSSALDGMDMNLLEGETHMIWMDQLAEMNKNLAIMEQNREIRLQREAFAAFNQVFYQCIKDYGLEGMTAYYQYCPMAFDNTGAYWLSEIKEIRNPYFGNAMLTCGETREILEF
ncbi:MAG: efflux RND transporter periplasmic adaptor subunit [Bacteroidales bacterium]|nr:efflux RND transporter periplasmic adaptor subunit [Bacteroidales bacterium]